MRRMGRTTLGARGAMHGRESSRRPHWDDAVLRMADTRAQAPAAEGPPRRSGHRADRHRRRWRWPSRFAVQWLLIKPYRIPSGSMEPTLDIGQRVLVNRLSHRLGSDPEIGDIITFHPPAGADGRRSAARSRPTTSPAPRRRPSSSADVHQARRRAGRRPHRRARRARRAQRQAAVRAVHRPVRRQAGLRLAARDHRPRGLRVPHGRQPRPVRRQPLLGAVPNDWVIGKAFATYWPPEAHRHPLRSRGTRRFNLVRRQLRLRRDQPEGYRRGHARVGEAIGSRRIGGTVYELPPGESAGHHYAGVDQWLTSSTASRRAHARGRGGARARRRRVFPRGPWGADWSIAPPRRPRPDAPTCRAPAVAVYPDSDKVGVFTEDPGARAWCAGRARSTTGTVEA